MKEVKKRLWCSVPSFWPLLPLQTVTWLSLSSFALLCADIIGILEDILQGLEVLIFSCAAPEISCDLGIHYQPCLKLGFQLFTIWAFLHLFWFGMMFVCLFVCSHMVLETYNNWRRRSHLGWRILSWGLWIYFEFELLFRSKNTGHM